MSRSLALLALALLAWPVGAGAQTLELRRRLAPEAPPQRGPVEFKYLGVKVTIADQVATTEIDQTFYNPNPWIAEGTYLFPLPEGTMISDFHLFMGGQAVKGEVLDADKAREIYQAIVRQRQDPGLLEFVGHRLIRASVFPIPAQGEMRITLRFTRPLTADSGWLEYEYPLSSTGSAIGELRFDLSLSSTTPIKTVHSPTHSVAIERQSDTAVHVRYEKTSVTPERGFSVLYGLSEKDLGLHLLAHRKAGDEGTFMLAITPKLEVKPEEIQPRTIAFVFDTSGSMAGPKMEQAKNALAYCINRLGPRDRFTVVRFSTEVETLEGGLHAADEAGKAKALAFVKGFEPAGGTNIDEAVETGLQVLSTVDGHTELVFLTDGKPTIGEREPGRILAKARTSNPHKARMFVFGVGSDLNTHLLDTLAEDHRGARTYVAETEDIELKVSRFYDKVACPVLTDLALDFGGLEVKGLYPARLPDLFRGGQLLVFGRYKGEAGARAITLTGKLDGREQRYVFETTLPDASEGHAYLPRLWAQRKVGHLLDQIRLHGENEEIRKEVIEVAKRYGIVTPYTSALVLEDEAQVRLLQRERRAAGGGIAPPASGPAGRPAPDPAKPAEAADAAEADGAKALREQSGDRAVSASEALKRQKEVDSLEEARKDQHKGAGEMVRQAGERTFYLDAEGCWVEAGLVGEAQAGRRKEAQELKALSDEYFALLAAHPELGQVLKLGKRIVFELKGTVYRIVE